MVVQHNIPALNSHRNLGINNAATAKNLEKLSSGYRINRAGDDAAGLAISEKMRGQIRGLGMAEQNASHGINLIQTAEGGLNETHAILQRMRELAVQSSNATYQDEDRAQIEKEFQALKGEIDRIASSTHYNNIKVLDGTTGSQLLSYAQTMGVELSANTRAALTELGFDLSVAGDGMTVTAGTTAANIANFTTTAANDLVTHKIVFGDTAANTSAVWSSTGTPTATGTGVSGVEFKYNSTTKDWTAELQGTLATGISYKDMEVSIDKNGTFTWTELDAANNVLGTISVTIDGLTKTDWSRIDNSTNAATFTIAMGTTGTWNTGTTLLNAATGISAVTVDVVSIGIGATDKVDADIVWNGKSWDIKNIASDDYDFMKLFIEQDDRNWISAGEITLKTKYGEELTVKLTTATQVVPAEGIAAGTTISVSADTTTAAAFDTQIGVNSIKGYLVADNSSMTETQKTVTEMLASLGMSTASVIELDALFRNNVSNTDYDGKDAYLQTRQVSDDLADGFELVLQIGADSYVARQNGFDVEFVKPITLADGSPDVELVATLSNTDLSQITTNGTISFNLRDGQAVAGIRGASIATEAVSSLQFQIGANGAADQRVGLFVANMSSMNIGLVAEGGDYTKNQYVYDLSVNSRELANDAIDVLNGAIIQVAGQRAELGALQNRLEHTLNNLGVTKENLTAAESTIRDVDMAKEMMEFTKNNILVQAAQAMLAQANQLPQGVLSLLR